MDEDTALDAYLDALRALYRPTRAAELPLTLAPMRALLAALGEPQRRYPAVVVAGSVGKTTTALHTAALLQAHGLRVGLYTSPHLHLFRERIRVQGTMIERAAVVEGARTVLEAARNARMTPSTFEATTALAVWHFARQAVDVVVLEVGLGGRFDAVNAIPNMLGIITPIETEHAAMLGGTLESVSWHKAGIIQHGGQAVSAPQTSDVASVLVREAEAQAAALTWANDAAELSKRALNALQQQGLAAQTSNSTNVMVRLPSLPARGEVVRINGGLVLIDGGHTPASARHLWALVEQSGLRQPGERMRLVVGMLADKDAAGYLTAFDAPGVHMTLTTAPGHRAASAAQLAAAYTPRAATRETIDDFNAALAGARTAPEGLVVIGGSLRVAALAREAFGLLSSDDLAEAKATRAIFRGLG